MGAVLAVEGPHRPETLDALLRTMAERAEASGSAVFVRSGSRCRSTSWPSRRPSRPRKRRRAWCSSRPGSSASRSPAWRSKAATPGVDVQYPWEDLPPRHHDKELEIAAFYIDKYPVTNAQFKRFLDASGYRPKDDHNFLKDWKDGNVPGGLGPQAGDLGFARGRPGLCRLGRQAAAARMGVAVCGPRHATGGCTPGATQPDADGRAQARERPRAARPDRRGCLSAGRQPVGRDGPDGQRLAMDRRVRRRAHAGGRAPRRQLLSADRLDLVLPANTQLDQHAKYLLMAPCKDRAGTVGFRCVVDAK